MSGNPLRIVIVDDHPMFRRGVARTLSEVPELTVVAEGASADDAVTLFIEHKPDLMLLDLSMPGGGHAALTRILDVDPQFRIIVLTVSEDDADLFRALKSGARGYVLKGVSASTLVEAIMGVVAGESYVSPTLAGKILREMRGPRVDEPEVAAGVDRPFAHLTQREEQILKLVADGRTNKEVGNQLELQEKTVKHHMTRILQKLNARNRTEAARLFQKVALGQLDPDER
ncbi:response regulator transcription factor [Ensifer sp.]|uniref:response regulator transcription factor n=1 Tax=Ensifer sp. TaxID=1872086 RepID=UPI00289B43FB|nr:response regulator transcription factor [Ensifer sp.]